MTRIIYQGTGFLSCYDWFPLGNGPSDAWKFTEFCAHVWSLFRRRLAFSAFSSCKTLITCLFPQFFFIRAQICHLSYTVLSGILCFKLCSKSLRLWFKYGVWEQKKGWFKALFPVTTKFYYFLDPFFAKTNLIGLSQFKPAPTHKTMSQFFLRPTLPLLSNKTILLATLVNGRTLRCNLNRKGIA